MDGESTEIFGVRNRPLAIGDLRRAATGAIAWLPHKDSNLDKLIQNQLCYHYTMRQLKGGQEITADRDGGNRIFHPR